MALKDILATDRLSLIFAKKETAFGTGVKPGPTDQVLTIGEPNISQSKTFHADAQKRNTYSELSRIGGRFEVGTFSFPFYVKPSGALGTKPEGAQILEALFGREVVTASTKVEYFLQRLTDTLPSLTIWFSVGHFVYMAFGCLVNQGTFPIKGGTSDDSVAQLNVSGLFAEMRWTGTDEANETFTTPAQTDLIVKDAKKFSIGSYIVVGGDDNAGAGWLVDAVNLATNVLTLNTAISNVTTNAQIDPWLPAGTELGSTVHGRLGLATRGADNLPVLTAEISIDNKLKVLNEEKNGLDYPDRFTRPTFREIAATLDMYFDANVSRFFSEHQKQTQANIVIPVGDAAAKRFKLTLLNVELDNPEISGNEEKINKIAGRAFASATLDDELVLLFD